MADIVELVIKIPESEIPKRQEIIEIPIHFIDGKVCEAGGYGFDVLPKGHGRLIYAKDAIETLQIMFAGDEDIQNACEQCISDCPTIIEATNKEKEK